MYWSWAQSTGAEMRKYFTMTIVSYALIEVGSKLYQIHTVVDLLQCHDGIGGQALLSILIQQEGLRSNWTLLRWQHGGVLRGGIHGRHDGNGVRARRALAGAGRAATAVRCGEVSGGDGREGRSKAPVSDWQCLMCSEGVVLQRVRQPGRTRGQRNV